MSQPRDDRQKDLLRPALDEIIDLGHPLARLSGEIDWGFLDRRFASVCQAGPGQPGLPTRLVAGLFILKHMHNLSDEALRARWLENPYYQLLLRRVELLPQAAVRPLVADALAAAAGRGATGGADPGKPIGGAQDGCDRDTGPGAGRRVDTTVQPKADRPSDRCPAHASGPGEAGSPRPAGRVPLRQS